MLCVGDLKDSSALAEAFRFVLGFASLSPGLRQIQQEEEEREERGRTANSCLQMFHMLKHLY